MHSCPELISACVMLLCQQLLRSVTEPVLIWHCHMIDYQLRVMKIPSGRTRGFVASCLQCFLLCFISIHNYNLLSQSVKLNVVLCS